MSFNEAQYCIFQSSKHDQMYSNLDRLHARADANRQVSFTGHRSQVTGHRSQVTGYRSQVTGYRSQVKRNETFGGYVLRPKMMNKTCCG